ncbi:MAG TPA: hypothetical protein VGN17_20255 [Bryobacteraceae bacterium]|jgi:hypothetical protein
MISPTHAGQNSSAAGIFQNPATPSVSSSSFTQQLAAALEQYLGQSGSSSNLEIDVKPSQSQNPGGSQFLVTVKAATPDSGAQPATANSTASAASIPASMTAGVGPIFVSTAPTPKIVSSTVDNSGGDGSGGGTTLQPVTTPTDSNGVPDGYENVPFGLSSTTMPTLATELSAFNKSNSMLAQINPGALSNTAAQAGDPMYGVQVPGTSLNWNDLTQNQQLAYQHAMLSGLPAGQSMSDFLAANVGPSAWWNASYASPNMFGAPPAAGSVTMYNSPYVSTTA